MRVRIASAILAALMSLAPVGVARGEGAITACGSPLEGLLPCPPRTLEFQGRERQQTEGAGFAPARAQSAQPRGSWTFLFYDDADFNQGFDPFSVFCGDAYSTENVNVLILQDRMDQPAYLWYLTPDQGPFLLANLGELDMGDGATLRDFIDYGKTCYPADRYLVAMYDHGGGWAGACVDDTNDGWLEMDEIREAVTTAGGIDILCFTAPCIMGAIESAYELRDCVDLYIGSEEVSGYAYWWDLMGYICFILDNSAGLTTEYIARQIIVLVANNTAYLPDPEWLTMSAIKGSRLPSAIEGLDALTTHLIPDMPELAGGIRLLRDSVWQFGIGGSFDLGEVDLIDLIDQYAEISDDPQVQELLPDIRDALEAAIVAECHGRSQLGANGLSIFFPARPSAYPAAYANVGLDFTDDTHWDEFLEAYLSVTAGVGGQAGQPRASLACRPSLVHQATQISFSHAAREHVSLRVIDATGRCIRTLCNRPLSAGEHFFRWTGCDERGRRLPCGSYLCNLERAGQSTVVRLNLIR